MNIYDCSERKIVCVSNKDHKFFGCDENSPLLKVGETYTVKSVVVYGWHTEVEVYEFPNTLFNSTCFCEKRCE